jgi:hypothetical protein
MSPALSGPFIAHRSPHVRAERFSTPVCALIITAASAALWAGLLALAFAER